MRATSSFYRTRLPVTTKIQLIPSNWKSNDQPGTCKHDSVTTNIRYSGLLFWPWQWLRKEKSNSYSFVTYNGHIPVKHTMSCTMDVCCEDELILSFNSVCFELCMYSI
jgi:hypothetical protein